MGFKTRASSLSRKLRGVRTVHFLHIGKAAGTQITHVAEQINASNSQLQILKRRHSVRLSDLPHEADYFFSTRDPVSRFRSGFYSRKRKGQPRINSEWSPNEAKAFAAFAHANDLAEALFEDSSRGMAATAAMRSISHTTRNMVDWFSGMGFFLETRPPVWIIRTENFASDLSILMERLGVSLRPDIGSDPSARHANDYSATPPLSERAKENLRRWYAQDLAFLSLCGAWTSEQIALHTGNTPSEVP